MLESLYSLSHHIQNFPLYKQADGPGDGWYTGCLLLTFNLPPSLRQLHLTLDVNAPLRQQVSTQFDLYPSLVV